MGRWRRGCSGRGTRLSRVGRRWSARCGRGRGSGCGGGGRVPAGRVARVQGDLVLSLALYGMPDGVVWRARAARGEAGAER